MTSSRATVLKSLKRQKLIQDSSQLNMIIDATENGTIRDASSLREFVKDRFNAAPYSKWSATTWGHLSSVQKNECTTLVEKGSVPHDSDPSSPPPPPPTSMVEMTCAMKKLMYERTELPLVASSSGKSKGFTKNQHRVDFDRNDWFLSNSSEMERLTSCERGFDTSLCLVFLVSSRGRKYLTWCERPQVSRFLHMVNQKQVVCNKYVTTALQNGETFTELEYVDDNIGNLLEDEVLDTLYFMEKYIGMMGTRHPKGFNMPDVNHLVHRSLRLLGGDWELLDVYGRWKKSEDRLSSHISTLRELVKEVVKTRSVFLTSSPPDEEILHAMQKNIETRVDSLKQHLFVVKHHFETVRTHRDNLKKALIRTIADLTLHGRPISPKLVTIRRELSELPDCIGPVEAEADMVSEMDECRALKILGLWDGEGEVPFHLITRPTVKKAWNQVQKIVHSDKTGKKTVKDDEASNVISLARDYLYGVCKNVNSGVDVDTCDQIYQSIANIAVDLDV